MESGGQGSRLMTTRISFSFVLSYYNVELRGVDSLSGKRLPSSNYYSVFSKSILVRAQKRKASQQGRNFSFVLVCLAGEPCRHRDHIHINPANIMMDGEQPVIIDFDSTRPIGEKLGDKGGTFEWELEGAELSAPENDLYGLDRIREVTLQLAIGGKQINLIVKNISHRQPGDHPSLFHEQLNSKHEKKKEEDPCILPPSPSFCPILTVPSSPPSPSSSQDPASPEQAACTGCGGGRCACAPHRAPQAAGRPVARRARAARAAAAPRGPPPGASRRRCSRRGGGARGPSSW